MYIGSKKGLYHETTNGKTGDIIHCVDNGRFVALAMADGVSCCKCGNHGAEIASRIAVEYICSQYGAMKLLPLRWTDTVVRRIRQKLESESIMDGNDIQDYSSTLLAVLVDREQGLLYYCNIGDGILMTVQQQRCPIISMPHIGMGECPVVTTKNIERVIDSGRVSLHGIDHILICTDGAWKLIYQNSILKPCVKKYLLSGAFQKVIEYIETAENVDDSSIAIIETKGEAA